MVSPTQMTTPRFGARVYQTYGIANAEAISRLINRELESAGLGQENDDIFVFLQKTKQEDLDRFDVTVAKLDNRQNTMVMESIDSEHVVPGWPAYAVKPGTRGKQVDQFQVLSQAKGLSPGHLTSALSVITALVHHVKILVQLEKSSV